MLVQPPCYSNNILIICSEKVKWGDLLNSTVDKVNTKHEAAVINTILRYLNETKQLVQLGLHHQTHHCLQTAPFHPIPPFLIKRDGRKMLPRTSRGTQKYRGESSVDIQKFLI